MLPLSMTLSDFSRLFQLLHTFPGQISRKLQQNSERFRHDFYRAGTDNPYCSFYPKERFPDNIDRAEIPRGFFSYRNGEQGHMLVERHLANANEDIFTH